MTQPERRRFELAWIYHLQKKYNNIFFSQIFIGHDTTEWHFYRLYTYQSYVTNITRFKKSVNTNSQTLVKRFISSYQKVNPKRNVQRKRVIRKEPKIRKVTIMCLLRNCPRASGISSIWGPASYCLVDCHIQLYWQQRQSQ